MKIWKGSSIESLGKKQLSETNNLVPWTTNAVRQLWRNIGENRKDCIMVFIDLAKACDKVLRQEVWRCMREKEVPESEKYVRIVQDMHDEARTRGKRSGHRDGPMIFPEPLPFRHDYVCVGLRDKGSIPVVHVVCWCPCILVWHQKIGG